MSGQTEPSTATGKLLPWAAGVALAPLLFGSVNPPQQAIIGGLFGLSLFVLIFELDARVIRTSPLWWIVLICGVVLPLVPMPPGWVRAISPERVRLAEALLPPADGRGKFLTLTVSPAATWQRIWELSLIAVCFVLGRYAGRRGVDRVFVRALSLGLLALAASDIWYRLCGHGRLLGIWPDSAHHAAGTFANRNHFADWIVVASLFVAGWIIQPSASARGGAGEPRSRDRIFGGLAVAAGIAMAVLSGSRGGLMAFGVGLVSLIVMVRWAGNRESGHQKSPGAWRTAMLLVVLGAPIVLVICGGPVLNRFAQAGDLSFKTSIWRDAWRIAQKYPLVGTGPGTFEAIFSHYKTFGGDTSFLFAENDYAQTVVENGLLIGGIFIALVAASWAGLVQFARNGSGGMVFAGGVAALTAFLAHCFVEFVFEVTATAVLAGAIFGYLLGIRDRLTQQGISPPPGRGRILANLAAAIVMLAVCGREADAWWHWRAGQTADSASATAADLARSLRLWPGNPYRTEILGRLVKEEVSHGTHAPGLPASALKGEIDRELGLDAFNWRMRFEAFPLQAAESPAESPEEARRIIGLNPRYSFLPLYFARQFAGAGAGAALPFMRSAALFPDNLNAVFNLAWELEPGADLLWKIAPATDEGMQALGDFALSKTLPATSAAAFERISEKAEPENRAENFLNAHRADLALKTVAGNSARDHWLRSRAWFQLGKFADSIHEAEAVWADTAFGAEMETETGGAALAPGSDRISLDDAEREFRAAAAQRNLIRLRRLAESSGIPRIRWMIFQTERDLGHLDAAAQSAIALAGQALQSRGGR